MEKQKVKQKRGFALLSPDRRKEIAAMGGARAKELGVGHRWTSEEARELGKKYGVGRKKPDAP